MVQFFRVTKDALESIYYVAFIILTYMLVKYAKKTYLFESNKKYNLLCQFCVRDETVGGFDFGYALEVYNAGNAPAKNIEIIHSGKMITKIDFISPNKSFMYPMGTMVQTLGGIHPFGSSEIRIEKGKNVEFTLRVDGNELEYKVNPDILFVSTVKTGTLLGIEKELNGIAKVIDSERRRRTTGNY